MKYKEIKDIAFKVLSSYYNINYINSTNLDKHTLLFENDNLKLRVVPHKKYNYLSYSKKDKQNITSLLPLSDYMFEKCLFTGEIIVTEKTFIRQDQIEAL